MKASICSIAALLAPVAVLAADATTTAADSSSTCAADYIVETCLGSTMSNQQDCGQQDYSCQCAAYQAIVTVSSHIPIWRVPAPNSCPPTPAPAYVHRANGLLFVMKCFNNCPGDARQSTYAGLVTQYCALASQYSSTNTVRPTATNAVVSGTSSTAETTATGTHASTGTSTATSSGSSSESTTNAGAHLVQGAGSVIAAVAGVAAVLL